MISKSGYRRAVTRDIARLTYSSSPGRRITHSGPYIGVTTRQLCSIGKSITRHFGLEDSRVQRGTGLAQSFPKSMLQIPGD
jgi:hypothetical protein